MRASKSFFSFSGLVNINILLLLVVLRCYDVTVNSFSFPSKKSSSSPSQWSPSTTVASTSVVVSTKKQNKDTPRRRRQQQTPIISCSSVIEVQRAIDHYIEPDDKVLELGCTHYLTTDTSTLLFSRKVGTRTKKGHCCCPRRR